MIKFDISNLDPKKKFGYMTTEDHFLDASFIQKFPVFVQQTENFKSFKNFIGSIFKH